MKFSYIFILLVALIFSSCAYSRNSINKDKKSLSIEQFTKTLAQIKPESYEIILDKPQFGGAWRGITRIQLVDKKIPHTIRWANEKGVISEEKLGYKSIEFLISTNGDRRIGGFFTPDKRKVFHQSGMTFIYADIGMVFDSSESEKRLDNIVERSQWTSPVSGSASWQSWNRDIKQSLREYK